MPGVAVRVDGRWKETPVRPLGDLNLLASPYEMNLIPAGGLGNFTNLSRLPILPVHSCEWGTLESPKRVRDTANLANEFRALERIDVRASLLADAGLNLNNGAFPGCGRPPRRPDFSNTAA